MISDDQRPERMAGMYADQMDRARGFAQQVQREVLLVASVNQRGYYLRTPSGRRVGFVRYNVARSNAGRFAVYAYCPFDDPQGQFQNLQWGQPYHGWHIFIDRGDRATVQYAVKVLESAWDYR